MKALILFRSFHGNTKQAAEAMSRGIASLGHEATLHDLRRRFPDLAGIRCVLIGAPTRMGRVTRRAYRALKRLRKKGIGERPVAVFDTYGPVPTDAEELKKGAKIEVIKPEDAARMAAEEAAKQKKTDSEKK